MYFITERRGECHRYRVLHTQQRPLRLEFSPGGKLMSLAVHSPCSPVGTMQGLYLLDTHEELSLHHCNSSPSFSLDRRELEEGKKDGFPQKRMVYWRGAKTEAPSFPLLGNRSHLTCCYSAGDPAEPTAWEQQNLPPPPAVVPRKTLFVPGLGSSHAGCSSCDEPVADAALASQAPLKNS